MNPRASGYRNAAGGKLNATADQQQTPSRLWRSFLAITRTRRTTVVENVRYEEIDPLPLRRALAKGISKRYRIRFPSGAKMALEVGHARPIADLMGTQDLGEFSVVDPLMRPGDRVLLLHAGTGYGPHWLSNRLGPTGALVALDPDSTSIRYAKHRYHSANTALEVCDLNQPTAPAALNGELDGAFDAIIHRRIPAHEPTAQAQLKECWRLLAPGGALAVLLAAPSGHHDPREDPRLASLQDQLQQIAHDQQPGIQKLERVRVHARCGLLVQRAYSDDEGEPDDEFDRETDDGADRD
ncbi:MAG: class I SAM-dependent methyltransferase [Phycisphaerales bacterium]